jgi:hypothetical protein
VNEPELQRIGGSEERKAGPSATEHLAELRLDVTGEDESHRYFPEGANRQGLPTVEQVFASHEI